MASDPQTLANALSQYIAIKGFARVQGDEELHAAWKTIAGDDLAKQTRPVQLTRGTLTVAVENAPLLNELVSFQSADLLTRLKAQFPHLKIRNLKFRLTGLN
ncbi:MAG: DUF721 domain-containing protein [Planctomycetes bacterium]|nr:DUF721 domain-containing protein [Planctomycetota bacterium]